MKPATVAVFLLLPGLLVFGRTATDPEIAGALKRALRARDHLTDTAEVQVESAFTTGKDVCIEYRASAAPGQTISGLAVYRTEEDLVFLDNSWIWERACLSGKYGQRRNGKDVTRALNASLSMPVQNKPVAESAPPVIAKAANAPAQIAPAVKAPPVMTVNAASVPAAAVVQQAAMVAPTPLPVAPAPPLPSPKVAPLVVAVSRSAVAPVATVPIPAAPPVASVGTQPSAPTLPSGTQVVAVLAKPAPIAPPPSPTMTPAAAPATAAAIVPVAAPVAVPAASSVIAAEAAPIAEVAVVSHSPVAPQPVSVAVANPAASTQTVLHGVTIIDDNGALGAPTGAVAQTTPQESLADAARRVRKGH